MKIGIVGLPQSGKTTLFNTLVGEGKAREEQAHQRFSTYLGTFKLEDSRLKKLAEVFGSKKITFAEVCLVDVLIRDQTQNQWLQPLALRDTEALVVLIRCFSQIPNVAPVPLKEIKSVEEEFLLRDLETLQSRIKKIEPELKKGRKDQEKEYEILAKLNKHLEANMPLNKLELTPEEEKAVRGYKFLSQKPLFYLLNLDEQGSFPEDQEAKAYLQNNNLFFIEAALKLEQELTQLPPEEQPAFLESFGYKQPFKKRFELACLNSLGLITFFTVKGKEARAWLIDKNTVAVKAAGKVHSDMEHGFIRAEVINYKEFSNLAFSLTEARKKGLLRLEAKEYLVKDGDIIDFKFNV